MMATDIPIILITPDARADLEAEVTHPGTGGVTGGLLFGHPLDGKRLLVVDSVRLRRGVGFGREDFVLNQTRTSRQRDEARELSAEADYCGVWFIHRTPTPDLTDEELTQVQRMMEDPDFRFEDLACLVLCFYGGELSTHAFAYNDRLLMRCRPPEPTELRVTRKPSEPEVEEPPAPEPTAPSPSMPEVWYRDPGIARRLTKEYERLKASYRIETRRTPSGGILFQVKPKQPPLSEHLTFYLACGPGFPDEAPEAFLVAGKKRYSLFCPELDDWTARTSLVDVVDALIEWLPEFLNEYVAQAEEALERGDYREAVDLLTVVLVIDPHRSDAIRLLTKAQSPLHRSE